MARWQRPLIILLIIVGVWLVATIANHKQEVEIVYHLTWDDTGVAWHEADGGWTAVNDLGYTIQVQAGYVVAASVELVPCVGETAVWLVPQTVYAGHGDAEADPSRWAGPIVESLTTLTDVEITPVFTSHDTYCQAHYLVAQGTSGLSAQIEGTYIAPGTETGVPFTIESLLAWGALGNLQDGEGTAVTQLSSNRVDITIERELLTLFDGLDFAHMSAQEQAMAVLRSLANHTKFIVTTSS